MRHTIVWACTLSLGAGLLQGCASDDASIPPKPTVEAGKDATAEAEAGTTPEADAGPAPQRLLVTTNNSKTSELVAVDVATGAVDGRLTFPGTLGATSAQSALYPFLLEQSTNAVARLDSTHPWEIDSSWNVTLKDRMDGGSKSADPVAVIAGGDGKAYVLRYERNEIAVIQASANEDAGAPLRTIDLSGLLQPNDGDGLVEMTEGLYVAGKNMLYVVLENIDEDDVSANGEYLFCADTVSTIVGIDTTTDKVVSLGGTAPGGQVALKGYNPVPAGLAYDAAGDRILLFEEGCYAEPTGDAGAGKRSKGGVEAVSLHDFSTTILLDISDDFALGEGYPSGIVYLGPTDAVLGFDFTGSETRHWNPTETKLGALIPTAPDMFTYDGNGHLLGVVTTGSSTEAVSVDLTSGKSTTLHESDRLFTIPGGFIGSVDVWPHP
jgi:hypothetical protein